MEKKLCRWGILGTATIARKNWKAIWNAENATLSAVASRDLIRAQELVDECQREAPFETAPRASSYDKLLASDDVDAVYIPLPTGIRGEWVVRAAEAGKHVVCEKPCARSADDLQRMLDACRASNVQFMDGVMFMHSARIERLRKTLDDSESVGAIRRVATHFTFAAPDDWFDSNIRTDPALEPYGCLGDLGWYCIRLTLWAMKFEMPTSVVAHLLGKSARSSDASPVPIEFSAELFFPGGVTAAFYCSFRTQQQQLVHISGSKGYACLDDFVLPFDRDELTYEVCRQQYQIEGCEFKMQPHKRLEAVAEHGSGTPNAQETNLIRNFSKLALSGTPDPSWGKIALQTQRVMDACYESAIKGGDAVCLTDKLGAMA